MRVIKCKYRFNFTMLRLLLSLLVVVSSGTSQVQLSLRPRQFSKSQVFFPSLPPAQSLAPLIKPRSLGPLSSTSFSPSPQVQDTVVGLGASGTEVGDFLSSGWAGLRHQRHILPRFSPTPAPILVTPTTIRFTLDDVHAPAVASDFRPSWHPPLPLEIRPPAPLTNSVNTVLNAPFTKLLALKRHHRVDSSTTKTTTTKVPSVQLQPTITVGGFRPSPAFPFVSANSSVVNNLATRPPIVSHGKLEVSNSNTAITARGFRQPKALNFFGSESNIFSLRSTISPSLQQALILAKELASNSIILKSKVGINQNSFLTEQSADKETKDNQEPITKQPERKTFHFDENFLALLKKNNTTTKGKLTTTKSPSSSTSEVTTPFWFRIADEATLQGKWRLKGGARAPATRHIVTAASATQPIVPASATQSIVTVPTTQPIVTAHSTRSIVTIEKLTPKITLLSSSSSNKTHGKSRGLTISSSDDDFEVSSGPRVVPLGVQGEVGHAEEGPSGVLAPIVKHGVQSLNVSAWVTGCPKLYGEVELRCTVDHDPLLDNQMTMMWKKKSFTLGVPQEMLVSLDEALVLQDARFSLKNGKDHSYSLHIRDFRPSDCGTYECQAKAKQATAASQLLLFTCL